MRLRNLELTAGPRALALAGSGDYGVAGGADSNRLR